MSGYEAWEQELEEIRAAGLWRSFGRPPVALDLSSNDYLGLAGDRELRARFLDSLADWPGATLLGSTASRHLAGVHPVQGSLEARLAALYPGKRALLFNSGYHANTGLVPALVGPGDAVFADREIHASLIDGIRLSGARLFRYRHGDLGSLEADLVRQRAAHRRALVVSESVFSMAGDSSDVAGLVELKQRHGALLVLDEAHAFGVAGPGGAGLAAAQGAAAGVDLLVGTFGKALGGMGAFVAGPAVLIQVLIQKARSLLFSTALPPLCLAWVDFLLGQGDLLKARRAALSAHCRAFHLALPQAWRPPRPQWIVPLHCGSAEAAVRAAARLRESSFLAPAIRPPTVAPGSARLRVSLRADLDAGLLAEFAACLGAEGLCLAAEAAPAGEAVPCS